MLKPIIKKHLLKHPKLKNYIDKLRWNNHVLSDLCNTYFFRTKKEYKTPFGFSLVSRNYRANRLMLNGTFELEELEIIKKQILTADVFIDVGANIGYYSCLAQKLSKHVVAFEPQIQNLECLYTSLEINGWSDFEIFPVGLSDTPGLVTLYGASGPSASLIKGWAGYSERFKKAIPVNTMDNVLNDRFVGKKLFIKIDVEGAEYNVLKGAVKILNMVPKPTWFIEICLSEFHPGSGNPNFAETFNLFIQNGYEIRIADEDTTLITETDIKRWVTDGNTNINNFNYLFIPIE